MATVTGLRAERMLAIEAGTVVGGVVRDGILYFKRKDGGEYPDGVVVSAVPGPPGSITSSPAGGDLSGNYPNPVIGSRKVTGPQVLQETLTNEHVAPSNKDGSNTAPSLRTLGTGARQAAPGNHTHSVIPKVWSGTLAHAATSANAKTTIAFENVFPSGYFTAVPKVVITPDTGFPEAVTYYSVLDRTLTGFSICATRTSTTNSNFHFVAVQNGTTT